MHENNTITGDSVHISFEESSIREFYVVSNPKATSIDEERADSVFTEMLGDTLRFLTQDGRISQIISLQNASVTRTRQSNPERPDRMWGEVITTKIAGENDHSLGQDVRVMSIVEGNARAVYHDGETRNESSGDALKLFFDDDGVSRIRITGNVRGRIEE